MRSCSQKAAPPSVACSSRGGWMPSARFILIHRWERDGGLRIDLLLLSARTAKRLKDAGVDREVRGEEGASDHAPTWIILGDTSKSRRSSNLIGGVDRNATSRPKVQREARPQQRPLLVIDGDSFAHRAYHGVPKSVVRRDGKGVGAIVGFANFLLRLYQAERPRAVLVGWDTLTAPTYRHKKFPAYQSGRQFDESLLEQLDALPALVSACGFANAKAPGYEADDFLAAAAAAEERAGGTALVASGDRDTFQLVSVSTTIIFPVRAGKMDRIGPAEVLARYGVDPKQVPDFIALRGDPSDKLPGARGVGPKGAADLLRKYGTLEDILAAGRLVEQSEMLRLYKSIATMDASAPLPTLPDQTPTWEKGSNLVRSWELNQLADRLEELAELNRG
jgi:DNA polymerase I